MAFETTMMAMMAMMDELSRCYVTMGSLTLHRAGRLVGLGFNHRVNVSSLQLRHGDAG
jgi:hypothetical protein